MRQPLITTVALMAVLAAFGCERPPDLDSPKRFSDSANGIVFQYPGNWKVTDESEGYVEVSSTADAVFMVVHMDKTEAGALDEFAKVLDDERQAELERLFGGAVDITPTKSKKIAKKVKAADGKAVRHDFTLSLLNEKVPHIAEYHAVDGQGRRHYLTAQAATEDWDTVEPGFKLIYDTYQAK
jgi:hypothetical protein